MSEKDEYTNEVIQAYDEYLMMSEKRGISYGEIAYIQSLKKKGLDALYREAVNEIKRIQTTDES